MKKAMIVMMFSAIANTAFAMNTVELNSTTNKDIPVIVTEMSINLPEVIKAGIISPELQAKIAPQSLRKELKALGITAKVSVFQIETLPPIPMLAVEFASYSDFNKAKHLFDEAESGKLYYMGVEVSPRVSRGDSEIKSMYLKEGYSYMRCQAWSWSGGNGTWNCPSPYSEAVRVCAIVDQSGSYLRSWQEGGCAMGQGTPGYCVQNCGGPGGR